MRFCLMAVLALPVLFGLTRPAAASPVCNPGPIPALAGAVIEEHTFPLNGITRFYCVLVPAGFNPATPTPVVYVFHGGNGNARKMMMQNKRIIQTGNAQGYLVVFGQGKPDVGCGNPCADNKWNDPSDLDYVETLVNRVNDPAIHPWSVDTDRQFMAGFSGGAKLIYRMVAAGRMDGAQMPRMLGIATSAGAMVNLRAPLSTGIVEFIEFKNGIPVNALLLQGGRDPRMPTLGGYSGGRITNSFSYKIGIFRVLSRNITSAPPSFPTLPGAPANARVQFWNQPASTHEVLALLAPNLQHRWPGWFSETAFEYFGRL